MYMSINPFCCGFTVLLFSAVALANLTSSAPSSLSSLMAMTTAAVTAATRILYNMYTHLYMRVYISNPLGRNSWLCLFLFGFCLFSLVNKIRGVFSVSPENHHHFCLYLNIESHKYLYIYIYISYVTRTTQKRKYILRNTRLLRVWICDFQCGFFFICHFCLCVWFCTHAAFIRAGIKRNWKRVERSERLREEHRETVIYVNINSRKQWF